ncbi:hypothetical protein FOQG_13393 [Fusarium oxysporum f. sp. raphani 54005]|uniref:Uncharacterized protein n=1 Tax=Fusarium oxysporum f. sp. raphani 54005 TaxID=1089458 RepID=X0BKA2_FUSOX|nr:hypothetical protein FOQG_13393 [Fusarium oxysporum f. sp. raphani 54005]
MRFYEPTLQLGAFSRRHDSSQLTLYPQPRRNKGLSYNTDAEDMAHLLAKLHNFDVVYIVGMDRKFLKAGHAFAFATIIISYPLDVECMPNKVPRQMYQIEPQKCEGPWASEQLPTGFQTGYNCLYEISKSVSKFIDEQGPMREANMKKHFPDAGEVLTEEALYQRYMKHLSRWRVRYCRLSRLRFVEKELKVDWVMK